MPSKGKIERWLLADWNGGRLLKSSSMIKVTEEVKVGVKERNRRSKDLKEDVTSGIKQSSKTRRSLKAIENTPNTVKNDEKNEGRDYSPSASSWEPSDEESSESESDHSVAAEQTKSDKFTKQYVNKKSVRRGPKPMHRPNAIVTNALKVRQVNDNSNHGVSSNENRKYRVNRNDNNCRVSRGSSNYGISHNDSINSGMNLNSSNYGVNRNDNSNYGINRNENSGFGNSSTPTANQKRTSKNFRSADSSGRNHTPPRCRNDDIDIKELLISSIKSDFVTVFKTLDILKAKYGKNKKPPSEIVEEDKSEDVTRVYEYNSESEESNRSDDNVLISNKYNRVMQNLPSNRNQNYDSEEEWVPIGSGKTMIHKNKFRKVNWKSYTIATRTLLLAAFPRRILATHSLTGKRSPAFQNKPAKMCLDPKIVSDIILEITSKFKVKENFVRSIITTKCADECKMYKSRMKNKKKSLKNEEISQQDA